MGCWSPTIFLCPFGHIGHEDDRPNTENHNLHLHDYTTLGLRLKSLQSMYFSLFLSYKPE
jgi:hypothetical protein